MDDTRELQAVFARLADEELVRRITAGGLTDFALPIARAEAHARGLPLPVRPPPDMAVPDEVYHGDFQTVASHLTPTEAHVLCDCLRAGGLPAIAADVNLTQAHSWLAPAMGGASVRVPAAFVGEATALLAAFREGSFQLDDDFDESASPAGS